MHIVHVVYRFGIGGLENGLVKIVTGLPQHQHTIISLTDADPIQEERVREVADVICMHKAPGQGFGILRRIFLHLRSLRPDVLHTRNIGTLEVQLLGLVAGVPGRVHSEHGWDVYDPDGTNRRFRLLRRVCDLVVNRWIGLSGDLCAWLERGVGIRPERITRITNGVDTTRIAPAATGSAHARFVTVTRLSAIKNPLHTIRAFFAACETLHAEGVPAPALTVVGDGPLMEAAVDLVGNSSYGARVHLAGKQADVVPYLNDADIFVLGSSKEGISNTILEAMAAGLGIVVTDVGGNSELLTHGVSGLLVDAEDVTALADAMSELARDADRRNHLAREARRRVENEFSIARMVRAYEDVYQNSAAARPRKLTTKET